MPTLIPYHLTFPQGVRVGEKGMALEESAVAIPADTLFSALIDCGARTGIDPTAFLQPFVNGVPPFLLTSAFPRAGRLRFFPMPVDPASLFAQPPDAAQFKSLKRVRYLSEGLFRRALGGAMLDDLWQGGALGHPSGAPFLQNGALWLLDEERALLPEGMRNLGDGRPRPNAALRELSVWEQQSLPHVTVDRVQSASNIYFIKRTHFADGCGLWFGVQWLEPRAQFGSPPRRFDESLHRLIHVLGDEGVGGKRSSGNGRFLAEDPPEAVELPDAIAGEPALLLSRVSPRADELPALLADPACAYQIASVAGWMGGMGGPALRRKRVNLLVAGSRVSPPALPVGRLVDVTPAAWADHKVYRYGYGLAVGAGQEDPNGRLSHL